MVAALEKAQREQQQQQKGAAGGRPAATSHNRRIIRGCRRDHPAQKDRDERVTEENPQRKEQRVHGIL